VHELSSSASVDWPFGEGASTIALRPFSALMMLFAGVAAGFVDGVIAATTPDGPRDLDQAALRIVEMMPTERALQIAQQPHRLAPVLRDLVGDVAETVSRTADSASARLRAGSTIAQPARHCRLVGLSPASSDRAIDCAARARATTSPTTSCASLVRGSFDLRSRVGLQRSIPAASTSLRSPCTWRGVEPAATAHRGGTDRRARA
jgi:hypothetical protein